MDASVRDYSVAVVRATRRDEHVKLVASPRVSLRLHRAVQAFAALRGRHHILHDDVKLLAVPALAHRVIVKTEARPRERTPDGSPPTS